MKFLLVYCFALFNNLLFAQDIRSLDYGLKTGPVYSSTSDLQTTILSEPYFTNYSLNAKPRWGWTGGGFLNFRFSNQTLGLQTEIMYAQQGSDLLFNNMEKDFHWRMQFKHQYINLAGLFKLYPWGSKEERALSGLNVGVGPQLGFAIASDNIVYTSWGAGKLPQFGPDLLQQQQIRNVLKGKSNFGFNVGLGYRFRSFGLVLDARYFTGITDVVETQSNSYNFIEDKNTNKAFQFTVGWDFSFFNK